MELQLGLSGEKIDNTVSPLFKGVGMIRSEYLCRQIKQYITTQTCQNFITDYVKKICKLFMPAPVWYRTIEMEVLEINALPGVDKIIKEKNTILGFRGIRRAQLCRSTFLKELQIISSLSNEYKNIHLLIPYIHDVSELVFVKDCIEMTGFTGQLGIMAEIPSVILCLEDFLEIGIDNVTLGMNDLTSLTLGAYRGSTLDDPLHPALKQLVRQARAKCQDHSVSLSIAGYVNEEFLKFAQDTGYDYAVIQYSKLEEVYGKGWADLPHSQDLQAIKDEANRLMRFQA